MLGVPRAILRSVKNSENNDLLVLGIDFVDDHVGEISDRPFIRAGNGPDVPDLRKLANTLGLTEDARSDAGCGLGAARFDVEVDSGYVIERFKGEAYFHTPTFFFSFDTSPFVASLVVPC